MGVVYLNVTNRACQTPVKGRQNWSNSALLRFHIMRAYPAFSHP